MFLAILEFVFVDLSNNLINKTPQIEISVVTSS